MAPVVPLGGADVTAGARRYPRWQDAVGAAIAGLWPVALTLGVLGNPDRYDPYALFSGLGRTSTRVLPSWPTADPGIYSTQLTLGTRAATLLVHGHLPWWNPFEALGAPLAGEMESGALFPLTPVLLLHDGSLIFHLVLMAVAGVATYFLLRELRCGPVVATIGGMLFATNGTYAWLANAVATPVCFLPILLLGVERSRRHAADERGGGWRWLAVGTALALLAGFVEVAALGLILASVVAVQRGWTLPRERVGAYARKVAGAFALGIAVASPLLVAFYSYLQHGYVAGHAGNAADHGLSNAYVPMLVAPYLFGRVHANPYPEIHALWGAVGGYAGFALLALSVASLFGRRERGLRVVLACWVGVALADTMGTPWLKNLVALVPVTQHIVLFRYLPPTWELAMVILAAFALRDLATAPRATSIIAVTTGVLTASLVLLVGMALSAGAVRASRTLAATSLHQSELIVLCVVAGLLLAACAPGRYRGLAVGAVAVAEAGLLFAIPIASWPSSNPVDQAAVRFLQQHASDSRIFSLGIPTPNFGSQVGVRQLDVVDLPVPSSLVPILRSIDRFENPTRFTGSGLPVPGAPSLDGLVLRHLHRLEELGVRYVVTPAGLDLFAHRGIARLAYEDALVQIWRLDDASPLVRAPGCGVRVLAQDAYVVSCPHPTLLVRTQLYFPGWSATLDGRPVPILDRGRLQAVALPRGGSVVKLTYLPPYVPPATAACVVALLALLLPYDELTRWRRHRRERTAWSDVFDEDGRPTDGGPTDGGHGAASTGAVAVVVAEDEPATSAVPAVTGSVAVVSAVEHEGPPTTSVAVEAERPRAEDPPTIAVPLERPGAEPSSG